MDASDIISLVGVGVALMFSVSAYWSARKGRRQEIINSYFKEYRSWEMGEAVAELWHFFRDECKSTEARMITAYVEKYRDEGSKRPFHMCTRRRVSSFCQELAVLAKKDCRIRKTIYDVWGKGDLEIIDKILIPIETQAIPQALGNPPTTQTTEYPEPFKAMKELYDRAPGGGRIKCHWLKICLGRF